MIPSGIRKGNGSNYAYVNMLVEVAAGTDDMY